MPCCYYCGLPGAKHPIMRPTGRVWVFCDECYEQRMREEETAKIFDGMSLTEQAWAGWPDLQKVS